MSRDNIVLTPKLAAYLESVSPAEPPLWSKLRAETARRFPARAGMQIGAEQARFMQLLARAIGARRALEVGCFTGMSALAIAAVLPRDGGLVTLDVSPEFTAVARKFWEQAGLAERIELRLAPALASLRALKKERGAGSFDFAFIDADKENVDAYYEAVLALVRPGGLVLVDNTLWSGAVADGRVKDADTVALRKLNAKIAKDERVDAVLLPIADGLTVARKR
ncbi:MAG: O-methyltransferase [Thermoplasmatota archaeon]